MQVGWIGLGSMGKPMALTVLGQGHGLAGYARRPAEHDEIRDAGGVVTDSLADTVATADIVCVNLYSEGQLHEVMVERGALAAMPAGAVLVIHSTVSPQAVRQLAALRSDVAILDAGFSGGPQEAANGKLTLMVGGDVAAFERARPLFTAYADHIAHLGPSGAGMTLKVVNNLMFAAHVAIAQDALRMAEAEALDLQTAIATLSRGSGGSTALVLLGRSGDPHAMIAGIRHYLDKDVAIARHGSRGMELGVLDAATRGFG